MFVMVFCIKRRTYFSAPLLFVRFVFQTGLLGFAHSVWPKFGVNIVFEICFILMKIKILELKTISCESNNTFGR